MVKPLPSGKSISSRRIGFLALLAIAVSATAYFYTHRAAKLTSKELTSKDMIVLADFDNRTEDPVFDGTLHQALSAQLEQSPFLNLLSDERTGQTLALMAQPKNARLTPKLAHEVCQRTASAAVLDGSIAQIGTRYLITLKAVNCVNGDTLASTEAQATDKNHVLDALGKVATEIRSKLGESLASVQKYDVPTESVTTPSLEALKTYTLAHEAQVSNKTAESVPLYEHAVSQDPKFAMAYLGLGISDFNLGEMSQAANNVQKAYELRGAVSEREKLGIELIYDAVVTGNFDAALRSDLLCAQIYPRDARVLNNLALFYSYLGDYEKSVVAGQEAVLLNPGSAQNYSDLVFDDLHSNRLQEAKTVAQKARNGNLDSAAVHAGLYMIDFLQHDPVGMEREATQVMDNPASRDLILYYESDSAAYSGHFEQARQLSRQAEDSALRAGQLETMAGYEAEAALREALVGNMALAKEEVKKALSLSNGRDVVGLSAIALALAGEVAVSDRLGSDLSKRFPEDTVVQHNSLPSIRAVIAIQRQDPEKAIAAVTAASAYEMGQTTQEVSFVLYPAYFRGEAYLAMRQSAAAVAEFQKILEHPQLVLNEPIGALAHLELGRAYSLTGDRGKASAEYRNFLKLWSGADPDIPILKRAKAEYVDLE
jgi:tetratricopeptide (TPR) repeat protein